MTALLERLDPALAQAIIPLGEPDSMLQAREAIERGEDGVEGGALLGKRPALGDTVLVDVGWTSTPRPATAPRAPASGTGPAVTMKIPTW